MKTEHIGNSVISLIMESFNNVIIQNYYIENQKTPELEASIYDFKKSHKDDSQ